MRRGKFGDLVKELTEDVRRVMEPHTARNLWESKTNKLKDFVQVSARSGCLTSPSERHGPKARQICRTPRAHRSRPCAHVHARSRWRRRRRTPGRPRARSSTPARLNNSATLAPKLATITFQNLFPPINV